MKSNYSMEYMLSTRMFYSDPEGFYDFYKNNLNCLSAKPNATHKYLTKLENSKKLKAIITQNIDGLHSKAGNKNVYEIHGTINKNHCLECGKEYDANYVFSSKGVPKCSCGGIIKPDVVLYGEQLPIAFLKAQEAVYSADMLIVAGTSLTVQPASGLINIFHGKYLVIINNDATPYDDEADLVIHRNLKEVFEKLVI